MWRSWALLAQKPLRLPRASSTVFDRILELWDQSQPGNQRHPQNQRQP